MQKQAPGGAKTTPPDAPPTEPKAEPFVAELAVYTDHEDKLCAADDPNRVFKVIGAGDTMDADDAHKLGLPTFIKTAKKNAAESAEQAQTPGAPETGGEDK